MAFLDELGGFLSDLGQGAGPIIQALTGGGQAAPSMFPQQQFVQGASLLPAIPAGLGGLAAAGGLGALTSLLGDPSGGMRSPFGSSFCIEPTVNAAGQLRFPKQAMFQTGPSTVETYVRAPKVRYKVTGTIKRRRCCPR